MIVGPHLRPAPSFNSSWRWASQRPGARQSGCCQERHYRKSAPIRGSLGTNYADQLAPIEEAIKAGIRARVDHRQGSCEGRGVLGLFAHVQRLDRPTRAVNANHGTDAGLVTSWRSAMTAGALDRQ